MVSDTRADRRFGSNRPLISTYHVGGKKVLWQRYFVRIETALRRAVELLVLGGSPGDRIEIASNDFGFQVATVVILAQGRIVVNFSIADLSHKKAA